MRKKAASVDYFGHLGAAEQDADAHLTHSIINFWLSFGLQQLWKDMPGSFALTCSAVFAI